MSSLSTFLGSGQEIIFLILPRMASAFKGGPISKPNSSDVHKNEIKNKCHRPTTLDYKDIIGHGSSVFWVLFSSLLDVIIVVIIHGGAINIKRAVIPRLLHMDLQLPPKFQSNPFNTRINARTIRSPLLLTDSSLIRRQDWAGVGVNKMFEKGNIPEVLVCQTYFTIARYHLSCL